MSNIKKQLLMHEEISLKKYTVDSYLNYSMYVILDRALPHIADGLKPVQRRIAFAMSELGLKHSGKHKKSARTVGDVLGKYHPHGDSACYEAMVLMAQPFSYRYPLIEGQGNWGSIDNPKSFAAMRYTEAKLSPYAESMLSELAAGTVDWQSNFDGSLEEPKLLPAELPNILLNGSSGIAVGMSTDIPPHNLREVGKACIELLTKPKMSIEDLCQIVLAPDFPSKCEIITPKEDIIKIYIEGKGSIKSRGIYHIEDGEIIVDSLPYQSSGTKVVEQIAAQMQKKKLPLLIDIRDESDHENPTRIVLVPRSNRVNKEQLMSHLFATTDLEKNHRINMNVIGLDGKPEVKGLKQIIREWLDYRVETVTKRLNYRLNKVNKRLHILDGLLIAHLNIDEVIRIIRTEDRPKQALMKRFNLTNIQAEAILELKLRFLAKLEEIKINTRKEDLSAEKEKLEQLLNSPRRLKTFIAKEIKAAIEKHGDDRRSSVVIAKESIALSEDDFITSENLTIVLSQNLWIRAAKGHEVKPSSLNYRAGDKLKLSIQGKSNQNVLLLDSSGKVFTLAAHTLPSARGQGEPITGRINLSQGAEISGLSLGDPSLYYLLCTSAAYGFIIASKQMITKNKSGKQILNVPKGANVLNPIRIEDINHSWVAAVSNEGRLLVFPTSDLPQRSKGKGNKIMQIPNNRLISKEEWLQSITVIGDDDQLIVRSGKRHLRFKMKDLVHYQGERGRRGNKLPRGFQKVDALECESKAKNN